MFIIDNILLAPIWGVVWVGDKIYKALEQETENEIESIRNRLRELHMELETGSITEDVFDRYETELLDLLDEIELANEKIKDKA